MSIDLSSVIDQPFDHQSIARLIGPELMVEAAVLLKNHYDMVDLGVQALQVRLHWRLRAHQWRESRFNHSSGTCRRNRCQKFAPCGL